jgi:hypothetical protein
MTDAHNSPIGQLTDCLLDVLKTFKLSANASIPSQIAKRTEQAMAVSGEGGDHAVVVLCHRIDWLYWLDAKWTIEHLIPRFGLEHPQSEPAWNGFLWRSQLPTPALFKLIKAPFLAAFARLADWHWDESTTNRLSEILTAAAVESEHEVYLSYAEARAALQSGDDAARSAALWQLHAMVDQEDDWSRKAQPFLEQVWPKELKYQTAVTSRALTEIAVKADSNFPNAVQTILPFLRPTEHGDRLVLSLTKQGSDTEASLSERFPVESVELLDRLIASTPRSLPYGLSEALESAATARPAIRQDLRWRRLSNLLIGA